MKPVHFVMFAVIGICFFIDKQTGIFVASAAGLFYILHIHNGVPPESSADDKKTKSGARPNDKPRDPNQ